MNKKIKIIIQNVSISALIVLGAACSNQQQTVVRPGEPTVHRINVIEYYVQPRDSLSKISHKLTGSLKNWREIGHFNGVYDPKDLQVGASLLVPEHLVTVDSHIYERSVLTLHLGSSPKQRMQAESSVVAQSANPGSHNPDPIQPVQVASAAPTPQPIAQPIRKLGPVFQPESLPGAPRINASTRKVNVNRHFNVTYFDAAATNDPSVTKMIRVVGTYYPKGIYSEPEASASLLMRVAPGSTFVFQAYLGDWLKIKTDSGIGYIRKIDATILGSNASNDGVIISSI